MCRLRRGLLVGTGRDAVYGVVAAHDLRRLRMCHAVLESRKVGFSEVLIADNGVEGVPRFILKALEGVRGCMLAGGRSLRQGREKRTFSFSRPLKVG